jgi:hypothetical protein
MHNIISNTVKKKSEKEKKTHTHTDREWRHIHFQSVINTYVCIKCYTRLGRTEEEKKNETGHGEKEEKRLFNFFQYFFSSIERIKNEYLSNDSWLEDKRQI